MHKFFLSIIIIGVFVAGFFLTQEYLKDYYSKLLAKLPVGTTVVNNKISCDDDCRKTIVQEVEKAVNKVSSTEEPQITYVNSKSHGTDIVSVDSNHSTKSTSWVDVPGSDVILDLANDYSKDATVTWSATLKVKDSNGVAYARIFDVTHGIVVDGSEISTTNNADYMTVASGNLSFWQGKNTYRVQIKSLNSLEVSYAGGKLRISY